MVAWQVGYLAGWLARLVGWKAFHPVGVPHSLIFWPPVARRLIALDWLAGWLVDRLADSLADRLSGWLATWYLAGRLVG